jgi:tRNA threonylcarbamoyl adenosine modification protein (Sua5/YciO/YrdC/YwlC family)
LWHPKRNTVGIRVPNYVIVQQLLTELNGPILSVSLIMPDEDAPLTNADAVLERLGDRVDGVVDAGWIGHEPTTVVDFTTGQAEIIRQGAGKVPWL